MNNVTRKEPVSIRVRLTEESIEQLKKLQDGTECAYGYRPTLSEVAGRTMAEACRQLARKKWLPYETKRKP